MIGWSPISVLQFSSVQFDYKRCIPSIMFAGVKDCSNDE
jgi:hypothetical protein